MTPMGWGLTVPFVAGTTATTILFQIGVKLCGPQYASILSTSEPLTGAVADVIFLHEKMTLRVALGITCKISTVALLAWKKNEKERAAQ